MFVRRRRARAWTRNGALLWALLPPLLASGAADAGEALPVKIAVIAESEVIEKGADAHVAVVLQDARSRPAPAKKELAVDVAIRLPSGTVRSERVVFAAGESKKDLSLPMPEAGLVEVSGRQRQLLQGSAALLVREAQQRSAARSVPLAAHPGVAVRPPPAPAPRMAARVEAERAIRRLPTEASPPREAPRMERPQAVVRSPAERRGLASAPPSGPGAGEAETGGLGTNPVVLAFYVSPGRPLLADGHDAAMLDAFVKSPPDGVPVDTKVWLRATSGDMSPVPPLELAAGEMHGRVQLTSQQIADISVRMEDVQPRARIDGEREFQLHFAPPITGITLSASPPTASIFDTVALVVELRDEESRPVVTDTDRPVQLTLAEGEADLDPAELTIAAGQSSGHAVLHPRAGASLTVVASTPGLLDETVQVPVRFLPIWLVLMGIAGVAGGWIARQRSSPGTWLPWRGMLTGLLAGPALYWVAASLEIPGLPRTAVSSLFGMGIIAVIGGYLGTEVFELARRLILGGEKA